MTPPTSSRWRAVLFDRDGTLACTNPEVYREAALWLYRQFGLEPQAAGQSLADVWQDHSSSWWTVQTPGDEDAFWKRYGETLGARLGLGADQAERVLAAYPYERFLKPVAGAREVLSGLRARGLKTGVLSNTLPSIDRTLRALGLDDLVDVAVASCAVGVHKPEAGAFLEALRRLELPAGAVLFVDDLPENVQAAQVLGLGAVQIDLSGGVPGAVHSLWDVLTLVDEPVAG